MATYGKKMVKIRIGKNLHIAVNCFIADVKNPILGWDWMEANDIEVRHHYVKGEGRKYSLPIQGRKVYLAMAKPKAEVSIHAVEAGTVAATRDSYQLWAQQQLVKSTSAAAKKPVPRRYQRLLEDFPGIGSPNFKAQPLTNHTIETGESKPCTAKVRPLAKGSRKHDLGKKALEELVQLGVAQRLANDESPTWTSALHLQVKADGTLRPCGDYRLLNQRTHLDGYPLPNLAAFAANLSGAKWFAKCDLTKAYYNVGLDRDSSMKTAIVTQWGTYRFTRLSMGLKNSAQTFQRLLDNVLEGLEVFAYIDDILVYADSEDELEAKLRELFGRLQQAGLALNLAKCEFGVNAVDFLGFRVTPTGISPLEHKTQAVVNFPPPTTAKALLGFLGAANYYRRCLPPLRNKSAAAVLQPLYAAATMKSTKKFTDIWKEEDLDRHFKAAKQLLVNATELAHPDPRAKVVLTTDASLEAMGGVLEQHRDGKFEPLGWWSRHFNPAQRKWSTFKRELYGVHQAIRHFLPALKGREFVVFTDHQPLVQAMAKSELPQHDPIAEQHLLEIGQWCHDVRHVAGKRNAVSDWLSRPPHVRPPDNDDMAPRPDAISELAIDIPDTDVWDILTAIATTDPDTRHHLAVAAFNGNQRWGIGAPGELGQHEYGDSVATTDTDATASSAGECLIEIAAADALLDPALLAVDQANCKELQQMKGVSSKKVHLAQVTIGDTLLWCNLVDGNPRPFLPKSWRKLVTTTFHQLHHPGPEATAANVSKQYYWPALTKDVKTWTKSCVACQSVKATKAIKPPMDHRPVGGRFTDVQCDVVGPLPQSRGMTHLLTICDRATNWQEAVPMPAATALNCVNAFAEGWIASKGIPSDLTCDNGNTFRAGLWADFNSKLGLKVDFTPLYHPQSLGSGERAHKDLKTGLKARLFEMGDRHGEKWMDALPWVLLGRRNCYSSRFKTSAADLVYGQTLQVPGSLLQTSTEGVAKEDPEAVLRQLQQKSARPPTPTTGLHDRSLYWPATAAAATHVYINKGKSKIGHPLDTIKQGPFPILRRVGKSVLDIITGKQANGDDIIERHHWENCQPAAVADDTPAAARPKRGRPPKAPPDPPPASAPASSQSASSPARPQAPTPDPGASTTSAPSPVPSNTSKALPTTRSGRQIKRPERLRPGS